MEEWKEYKLGDVSQIKGGKRLPKGVNLITSPNCHPYIKVRDLGTKKTIELNTSFEYVDEETQKSISKYTVEKGDIIISIVGTIGLVAIIGDSLNNANLTENCVKIVNSNTLNKEYLYYYLISKFGQDEIKNGTVGAVQAKLPIKNIQDIKVKAPSLSEQTKIASVLKSLDDKIEANRRINDNLEQQAQALFKSWFVDFEPFRDQPFVGSEMGMIPEGWRVGRYEEIIETTISGDWGKEKPEGNYVHKVACIRGCDFQDIKNGLRGNTPERYILEKNYQSKHFHHNDVLVEISGGTQTVSTGRVCPVSQLLIDKFNADIVCTNFCRVIRPIAAYAAYLYYSWLYKYNGKVMFGYENGTSGIKNFRIKDFISVEPVVIPPADLLNKFQQFVDSVQLQIQTRGSESSRLAQLRDTLLPRLMSGELSVDGQKGQFAVSPGRCPGSKEHVSNNTAL